MALLQRGDVGSSSGLQPPRWDVKVIQLDIAPEEIGHNKATEVALVGDGKAIVGQLNQALAGRQWFYPKDTLPSGRYPLLGPGLSPAGSHQLCLAHSFDPPRRQRGSNNSGTRLLVRPTPELRQGRGLTLHLFAGGHDRMTNIRVISVSHRGSMCRRDDGFNSF